MIMCCGSADNVTVEVVLYDFAVYSTSRPNGNKVGLPVGVRFHCSTSECDLDHYTDIKSACPSPHYGPS